MSCVVGQETERLENDQSSFSNLSVYSPTSQLILQPFFYFSYVTGSSLNVTWVCSFSNLSITSPTPQLIPQSFCCFTYDTAHSPILPLLHLRHSSFSNLSVASPTSQLILQPIFRFSYVTGFLLTSPGEPPMETRRSIRSYSLVSAIISLFV